MTSSWFFLSTHNSFTLSSICFLFITMWSLHLSLWSKCMPRYFVTAAIGISTLLIVTGGHRPFLSVNFMWTDFVSFIFILNFLSQSWVRFKWSCKCCAAVRGSPCDAKMTVSSATVPVVLLLVVGKSDVYRTKSIGHNTLPCGTPAYIGNIS